MTTSCDIILCPPDANSLYTNIPHKEGLTQIKDILTIHKQPNELLHNSYINELLKVVLENNCFAFNGKNHHQVSGTAMGTKLVFHVPIYLWPNLNERQHV